MSPAGELFYVDLVGGTIRRVVHRPTSCPVGQYLARYYDGTALGGTPAATACEPAPLDRSFGTGAPPGVGPDHFSARWEGTFEFPTSGPYDFVARAGEGIRVLVDDEVLVDRWANITAGTFPATRSLSAGPHEVRVEWKDTTGTADAGLTWAAAAASENPRPQILTPAAGTTWQVGDRISFSGSAVDGRGALLPASALSWRILLHHCEDGGGCHAHDVTSTTGASGSFVAEDHEHPSHVELVLSATDGAGRTGTVTRRLDPRTVQLTLTSRPPGLQLTVGGRTAATPFVASAIAGGTVTVSAPSPQTVAGGTYAFARWSDGGARSHNVAVGGTSRTLTAVLDATSCPAGQYRAEYFPNRTLTGPAATIVCETAPLTRWWGEGAPPGMGVAADDFSLRWRGSFTFPGGARTFTAGHNNGMEVWLDGTRIVDRWNVTGTHRTTRTVAAGTHSVGIRYWEGTGQANASLTW